MNHVALVLLVHLADLCSAPMLWHVCRFPNVPIGIIKANLTFNRSYQQWLRLRMEVTPDCQWTHETLRENEMLWKAWDSLDDARNEMFSIPRRRAALRDLLQVIGPEAFERGEMPVAVPLWRFRGVR